MPVKTCFNYSDIERAIDFFIMPTPSVSVPWMNSKIVIAILVFLLVGAGGAAYYFYSKASVVQTESQEDTQKEVQSLIDEIGKLIMLPEGETPTIATVSNPERLKDQPFFAKAKAGDKVLIYTIARKAFLYDPVAGKLIEVAPLSTATGAEVETDVSGAISE